MTSTGGLDLREADLGPQELWMGWHLAEKALWPPVEGYPITDEDHMTTEYLKTIGSALFAVPPGVPQGATLGDDGTFVGQTLFGRLETRGSA